MSPRGVYVRTAETRERIRQVRLGTTLASETIEKITQRARQNARDPKWRKRVAESTKIKMRDPIIRERHLNALANNDCNFQGGQGDERTPEEQIYASILLPVGFVSEYPLQWGGRGERYRLDFAYVEAKVNIELDGSSHKGKEIQDRIRDERLRSLGWRVIRIRHD